MFTTKASLVHQDIELYFLLEQQTLQEDIFMHALAAKIMATLAEVTVVALALIVNRSDQVMALMAKVVDGAVTIKVADTVTKVLCTVS